MAIPTQLTGYGTEDRILPIGGSYTGRPLVSLDTFVIHGTANNNPGADAIMHWRYWSPKGAGRNVSSVHFVADDHETDPGYGRVIQLLPINAVGWHIGDPANAGWLPSHHTVAIEICENSGSNYVRACRAAARTVARVLHAAGLTPNYGTTIKWHGDYALRWTTHSFCPAWLSSGTHGVTKAQFIDMVHEEFVNLDHLPAYGFYVVAAQDGANIRQGPGVNFPVAATLPPGAAAEFGKFVLGERIGDSNIWGHLKDERGFVSLTILSPVLEYRVTADDGSNIRQGPATSFPIHSVVPTGSTVEFDKILPDGESVGDDRRWGHLADERGFIHLSTVEPVLPNTPAQLIRGFSEFSHSPE